MADFSKEEVQQMKKFVSQLVRKGSFSVLPLFWSITQIAKLFKILHLPKAYNHLVYSLREVDISEDEISNRDSFIIVLNTYWSSSIAQTVISTYFAETLLLLKRDFPEFLKHFGFESINDFIDNLNNEDRWREALIHFASKFEINDFFYTKILPDMVFNKKALKQLISQTFRVKVHVVDLKKVFLSLVEDRSLIVEPGGFVVVNPNK